jgi:hypothetical protein
MQAYSYILGCNRVTALGICITFQTWTLPLHFRAIGFKCFLRIRVNCNAIFFDFVHRRTHQPIFLFFLDCVTDLHPKFHSSHLGNLNGRTTTTMTRTGQRVCRACEVIWKQRRMSFHEVESMGWTLDGMYTKIDYRVFSPPCSLPSQFLNSTTVANKLRPVTLNIQL